MLQPTNSNLTAPISMPHMFAVVDQQKYWEIQTTVCAIPSTN